MPTAFKQTEAKSQIVKIGNGATPEVFTQIKGLHNIAVSFPSSDTDATDFDSAGWTSKVVMERGFQLKLKGFVKTDGAGAQDPGQVAVETLALSIGIGSVANFKYTISLGSSQVREYDFAGTVALDDQGGGNNDLGAWGATITSYGVVTRS